MINIRDFKETDPLEMKLEMKHEEKPQRKGNMNEAKGKAREGVKAKK
jgi:hypothetical protein